jgi:hypothetical protein
MFYGGGDIYLVVEVLSLLKDRKFVLKFTRVAVVEMVEVFSMNLLKDASRSSGDDGAEEGNIV